MKKINSFLLITLLISTNNLFSNDSLLDILQEAGDIATETKLNIKDMPSAITVLREEDFEKVGAKNLYEALALISGVELSMLSNGWLYPVIRGQRSAFLSGYDKIKFFIDGVAVNDTTRGTSHFYLDFPIELIDRIEVFRGANSALYGSGAYSGAIHIITKTKTSKDNNIFLSTGSGNKNKGGANYSFEKNGLNLKFDVYYQKENNSNPATPITLDSDKGKFEINRGSSDERLKDYSIGVYAQKDNFSLYSRLKSQKSGNYYGIYEILEENQKEQDKKSFISEVAYKNSFKMGDFILKGGVNIFENEAMFEVVPKEFGYYYGNLDEIPDSGLLSGNNYEDRTLYVDASFKFKKFYSNDLKIGIKKEYTKSLQNDYFYNENFQNEILRDNYINPDSKIDKLSFYLQNIYSVSENLDLSIFSRVDNYRRYKTQYSLQIGGIYRFNDEFKIKTVFNRAYRLPSWSEQLTSSLNSEKLKGIEASLIYEDILKTTSLQINLFSYTLTDTIDAYSIPTVTDNAKLRILKTKRDIDINSIMARVRGVNKAFILKDKTVDETTNNTQTTNEQTNTSENTTTKTTDIIETNKESTTQTEANGENATSQTTTEVSNTDTTAESTIDTTKPNSEIAEIKPNDVVVIKPTTTDTTKETSTTKPENSNENTQIEPIPTLTPTNELETNPNGIEPIPTPMETITPTPPIIANIGEIEPTPTPIETTTLSEQIDGENITKPTPTPIETTTPSEQIDGENITKPTPTPIETTTPSEQTGGENITKPTPTPIETTTSSEQTGGENITKPTPTLTPTPNSNQGGSNQATSNQMPPTTTTAISQSTEILPTTQTATTTATVSVVPPESNTVTEDTPQEVSSVEYYFKNINKIRSKGIEIEYSLALNRKNQINLSYSFVKLENSQTSTYLPATDQTLVKGVYSFIPMPNLRFHTFINYRSEIDKDLHSNKIDDFISVDETIVWQKDANSYYTISMKNLLDEDIRYNSITGLQPDGLKGDGRSIFISYRYQF